MLKSLWQIIWPPLRNALLPYPDIRRRRRIHRAARALVAPGPWPGDAASGVDAAQLALLHVLWLQRQTRRAVRRRSHDAAALTARVTLETCFLGVYCLHADDAVKKLAGRDITAIPQLLAYIADDDFISKETIKASAEALGDGGPDIKVRRTVEWLAREHGRGDLLSLYQRYYAPLSHFYVHPSASTLLRHVGKGGEVRLRPGRLWARRSPARLADACTGYLAAALAGKTGVSPDEFMNYAEAHIARTLTPVAITAVKGLGQFDWRKLPTLFSLVADLRRYTHNVAKDDDRTARETRIRRDFDKAVRLLDLDVPDAAFQPVINHFVTLLLDSIDNR